MHQLRVEITNYCNIQCSYCFSCDLLSKTKDEMTLKEFDVVLDYCKAENINEIALQGGEPTTHTHIDKIFKILRQRGFKLFLFTNGIFDTKILKNMGDIVLGCLINYNHPDSYNNIKYWKLVNRNIEEMRRKKIPFQLGYNLYEKIPDYTFFIKAIQKFKLKYVRVDIARPSGKFTNKHFNFTDLPIAIKVLAKFMKTCVAIGALPVIDCPLPLCMMHVAEFNFMRKYLFSARGVCGTELNIGPQLRLSVCPASIMTNGISLTDFKNISEAKDFMLNMENQLRWEIPLFEKCNKCFYRLHKLCQGGCIGYKKMIKNKMILNRDLVDEGIPSYNKCNSNIAHGGRLDYFKTGLILFNQGRFKNAFEMFLRVNRNDLIKEENNFIKEFFLHYTPHRKLIKNINRV